MPLSRSTRILIAYSTVDGHTLKISERLRAQIEPHGHAVTLHSLASGQPIDPAAFDQVVIGASIRYGRHRPEVHAFVRDHRRALEARPSAFFSVNVVARKPGKDTPQGNQYVTAFLRQTAWRPTRVAVFAGKIDYRRYTLLDRHVIRFIMWLTRGPTQLDACVEFTHWDAVDAFGRELAGA